MRLQSAAPAIPVAPPDELDDALDWNRSVARDVMSTSLDTVTTAPSSSQAAALFSAAASVMAAAAVRSELPSSVSVRFASATARFTPARKFESAAKTGPAPTKSATVANERVWEAIVSEVARRVRVDVSTKPATRVFADDW